MTDKSGGKGNPNEVDGAYQKAIGAYDDEPATVAIMDEFLTEKGYTASDSESITSILHFRPQNGHFTHDANKHLQIGIYC